MGVLATYTAYILIQFYRRYPTIRDVVDVARIMGGKPLEIIVGVAHVLNLCLICASANVTLSIALNTITEHAVCTIGFIGIPMIMCWLLCMPRSLNFAGWFGIPATISICKSANRSKIEILTFTSHFCLHCDHCPGCRWPRLRRCCQRWQWLLG